MAYVASHLSTGTLCRPVLRKQADRIRTAYVTRAKGVEITPSVRPERNGRSSRSHRPIELRPATVQAAKLH